MNASVGEIPQRSLWVLGGAFIAAMAINVALLLLIGALSSRRETALLAAPLPQAVDFIRIAPEVEESEPPLGAAANASSADSERRTENRPPPSRPSKLSPATPKLSPSRRSAGTKGTKTAKAKDTPQWGAAPRLDVPEHGTGASFAALPGTGSRLAAPPAWWNPAQKSATNAVKKPVASGGQYSGAKESEHMGGTGNRQLVVLRRVLPSYPPRALAQGAEGWVRLRFVVTAIGTVDHPEVMAAGPPKLFDRAALEAIRNWRFQPVYKEGRPVARQAELTIKFTLKKR